MRAFRIAGAALVFVATAVEAQQSAACPTSREALVAVVHDFWAGYNKRDVTLLDRVLDDQALLIPVDGTPSTKTQFMAAFRQPVGSIDLTSNERMDDVRTIVTGNTAVVSFKRQWGVGFRPMGITVQALSRMTETLICRSGRWRVLVFQETLLHNAERTPNTSAVARYDEYLGRRNVRRALFIIATGQGR